MKSSPSGVPPEMRKLGENLLRLRQDAGFSIREAAQRSGLSHSHIFKLENGQFFSSISLRVIISLAKTYDTPLLVLLQEAGFIENTEYKLPEFSQYLRLKYHLPNLAIRDMEMAKEIVDKKYQEKKLFSPAA